MGKPKPVDEEFWKGFKLYSCTKSDKRVKIYKAPKSMRGRPSFLAGIWKLYPCKSPMFVPFRKVRRNIETNQKAYSLSEGRKEGPKRATIILALPFCANHLRSARKLTSHTSLGRVESLGGLGSASASQVFLASPQDGKGQKVVHACGSAAMPGFRSSKIILPPKPSLQHQDQSPKNAKNIKKPYKNHQTDTKRKMPSPCSILSALGFKVWPAIRTWVLMAGIGPFASNP